MEFVTEFDSKASDGSSRKSLKSQRPPSDTKENGLSIVTINLGCAVCTINIFLLQIN